MNIYEITDFKNDDICNFNYVVHTNEFNNEEFAEMCEKARKELGKSISGYEIVMYLVENYKFKSLPIKSKFEYDID